MKIIFKLGDIMKIRDKYKTNNKQSILNYIINYTGSFSAGDIYSLMIDNNENIGLTTIYRYLDELEKNNKLKKFYNEKNICVYQYLDDCDCENHFYLKCNSCGKVIHIDCSHINTFSKHIMKDHDFSIDKNNLFISGICNDCRNSEG